MKNVSQLLLAIAAVIFSIAALAFALQGGTARAASPHYELQVVYDSNDKAEVMYVMDTETGKIWYADPEMRFTWGAINPQFSASSGSAPSVKSGPKPAPTPPPHH